MLMDSRLRGNDEQKESKLTQTTAQFVNIGERTNVTGSAAFKKLIMGGDYA